MSTSINEFKIISETLANKAQIGGSLSIPEFNEFAQRAQMIPFEKDRAIFLATQNTSDFLASFLKNEIVVVPSSGILAYPSDFEHTSSVRSYYVRPNGLSSEISVDPVKNRDWGDINGSQLQNGTKRFPKYSEFKDAYRFLPRNIGTVMIDYFSTPIKPVWAYTIVSGREVYDPILSVDFQWDEFAMNNVLAIFLQMRGMNLREGDLAQWATQFKQESESAL